MNSNVENILIGNALQILAGYYSTKHLAHPTVKGDAREALFRAAIAPWFGPSVRMGTGHVVNVNGAEGKSPHSATLFSIIRMSSNRFILALQNHLPISQ